MVETGMLGTFLTEVLLWMLGESRGEYQRDFEGLREK